jgi:glutamyl-tRNA synthetase
MDEELRDRVRAAAETHALINAVKHESDPEVGPIMGPLMGEHPEFREHGDEVPGVVGQVVGEIAEMSHEERRERLAEVDPETLEELEAEDEGDEHPLPDLPNAAEPGSASPDSQARRDAEEYDQIRMRAAPNPNGPWHIGHARMPAVIGAYADRYDGWFCVRFDDTDPETKRPDLDAYDAILEDVEYLGFEPDAVYRASDRMETYYGYARELIDAGGAYACSCPGEEFSELKNDGEPCPHREQDPEETLAEFERMVEGEYSAGEKVLRVRTDIEHKNPALRDFVAFRMVDTPHPRESAADYRCWPMLDFQSGIDDHELGITHIIRGIDLQDSAKKQRFVYDYFDWEYPEVIHWGHVQVDAYDVPMSTSSLRELIDSGELDGWDDPRAPTLKSLRRRGIRGEAVVEAMAGLGTSTSNVDLAMSTIYANNRELIDDESDRYFLVTDGLEVPLTGGPEEATPPLHPDHEDRGTRSIPVGETVLVEAEDLPGHGERVWLKGLGCVENIRDAFQFTGDDLEVVKSGDVDVIHWVPGAESVRCRLRTPDGDLSGRAEPQVVDLDPDEVVQFERVGFARIDRHDDEETVAYFAHE